jgi:hypothetical protein
VSANRGDKGERDRERKEGRYHFVGALGLEPDDIERKVLAEQVTRVFSNIGVL